MKNKKMLIIGGIIAVAGIGFLMYRNKKKAENPDVVPAPKPKMDAELTTPKPMVVKEVVEKVSTPTGTVEVKRTVGTTRATTTA
jgi:uncharacterized membrane protein YebE (DUF533 family)